MTRWRLLLTTSIVAAALPLASAASADQKNHEKGAQHDWSPKLVVMGVPLPIPGAAQGRVKFGDASQNTAAFYKIDCRKKDLVVVIWVVLGVRFDGPITTFVAPW